MKRDTFFHLQLCRLLNRENPVTINNININISQVLVFTAIFNMCTSLFVKQMYIDRLCIKSQQGQAYCSSFVGRTLPSYQPSFHAINLLWHVFPTYLTLMYIVRKYEMLQCSGFINSLGLFQTNGKFIALSWSQTGSLLWIHRGVNIVKLYKSDWVINRLTMEKFSRKVDPFTSQKRFPFQWCVNVNKSSIFWD